MHWVQTTYIRSPIDVLKRVRESVEKDIAGVHSRRGELKAEDDRLAKVLSESEVALEEIKLAIMKLS